MGEEKKLIYLDNAATTKTAPEVVEAMLPYFTELYGNPSSVYSFSQKSKEAITAGREKIAKTLGASPEFLYSLLPESAEVSVGPSYRHRAYWAKVLSPA